MSCTHEQKVKGFHVGQRVWSERERQYGTITKCNLPVPCGDDCYYSPCAACGGDGVDEVQKDRRCRSCKGYGRREQPSIIDRVLGLL